MKNKDIEELLNELKNKECYYVGTNGCLYQDLTKEEINLILSYIEQLEKDKKELKDGWQQEIYDKNKVLNDWLEVQRKIKQLENNRDKAIEYIEKHTDKLKNIIVPKIDFNYKKLLVILKGDSDE